MLHLRSLAVASVATVALVALVRATVNELLKHVLLPLAVCLERWARRLDRRVEVFDCVPAFLTDAIAKLESLNFANRTHI